MHSCTKRNPHVSHGKQWTWKEGKNSLKTFGIVDMFKDVVDNKVAGYCRTAKCWVWGCCACILTSTIASGHSGSNWEKVGNKGLVTMVKWVLLCRFELNLIFAVARDKFWSYSDSWKSEFTHYGSLKLSEAWLLMTRES